MTAAPTMRFLFSFKFYFVLSYVCGGWGGDCKGRGRDSKGWEDEGDQDA